MYRIRWTADQRDKFRARWVTLREREGLTQEQLALALDVSTRMVSRVERGTFIPRNETVVRFVALEKRYRKAREREKVLHWVPGGEEGI